MWTAILEALQAAWDWLVGLLVGFGQYVISQIIGLLPTSVVADVQSQSSTLGFALSAANAWVPIDYAVTLVTAYCVFVVSFLAVKVIVKLIP